ncbi:MAG: hypothetical protein ACXWV2_11305 [Chitinophagaceae bacterium]
MKSRKPWLPLVILFVILNAVFLVGKNLLEKKGVDPYVLIGGNLVLFLASILAFYISYRSLTSPNPNATVRSLYGSFMIKFFVIIIAAFAYIMIVKKDLNKPALFACMALYMVYSFIEVSSLQKLMKKRKNA